MKALVVFDSKFGNTEKVAEAVARGIGGSTKAARVDTAAAAALEGLDLLVIGSPVQGGRATKPLQAMLKRLDAASHPGLKAAAFDTRMTMKFAQRFGFAAVRIADELKARGIDVACPAEGFIVEAQKGPVAPGELERAEAWGRALAGAR